MIIKRWTRECKGCGEAIEKTCEVDTDKWPVNDKYLESLQCRCDGCACEVAGLRLPKHGTFNHGTGGGVRVIRETKTH